MRENHIQSCGFSSHFFYTFTWYHLRNGKYLFPLDTAMSRDTLCKNSKKVHPELWVHQRDSVWSSTPRIWIKKNSPILYFKSALALVSPNLQDPLVSAVSLDLWFSPTSPNGIYCSRTRLFPTFSSQSVSQPVFPEAIVVIFYEFGRKTEKMGLVTQRLTCWP